MRPMFGDLALCLAAATFLPPLAAQEPVTRGNLGARLDSLARAAEAEGFHGSVLVARRNEVFLSNGYGLAQHQPRRPFTPSTVVQIGSNVKDFTKVAILQLVEAGRLRLSDSLLRFFPNAPRDKRGITIEHLLNHRAGFPMGVAPDAVRLTREEFVARLFERPLEFAPGEGRQYSNAGYSVLAAIIEDLTGKSFDRHVDEAILRPAGMRETGLLLPGFDSTRVAHGYSRSRDQGTIFRMPRDAEGHLWTLRGNGGHLSTPADMLRFYRSLRGATLLREQTHRDMVLRADGPSMLAGSDGVCFFLFAGYPGAGVEIIIASNHAEYQGERLLRALLPVLGIGAPGGRRVVTMGPPGGAAPERVGGPAVTLPDSAGWRTVREYLEAFNSGDTAVMRRFFETRAEAGPDAPPPAVRLERYREMWGNLGRLTVESFRQMTQSFEVVVRTRAGERVTLGFQLQPAPPYRVRGLRIEVGSE